MHSLAQIERMNADPALRDHVNRYGWRGAHVIRDLEEKLASLRDAADDVARLYATGVPHTSNVAGDCLAVLRERLDA